MLHILAQLKPAQLFAAIKLMSESRAGVCAVRKLSDDPVEAGKMASRLKECGLVQVNEDLGEPLAVMVKPLADFAAHLKSYTEQLDFSLGKADLSEPPPATAKHSKRADMLEIVAEYARAKGIEIKTTAEGKNDLNTDFIKRNCRGAIALLAAAKSVDRAREVIAAVKKKMEAADLDWSLNGAVVNHMHGIIGREPMAGKKEGWNW